jgi:hypothetical protein
MIDDDELINMIRASATEQLPIAVMTVKEMRHFALMVALDCIDIIDRSGQTKGQMIRAIKDKYELSKI